jgi:RNA-binding protein 7
MWGLTNIEVADSILFVSDLETKVTGSSFLSCFTRPVIKVKIPKDEEGKPKQFSFKT